MNAQHSKSNVPHPTAGPRWAFEVRRWTFNILPAALLLLSGCFSRETTLLVHPDGSATLTLRTALTAEYVAYLKELTRSDHPERGFTEPRLQAEAARMGKGVRYRSHDIRREDDQLILEAVFHVPDLNHLRLSLNPALPLIGDRMEKRDLPAYPPYTFHWREHGPLTIYPPQVDRDPETARVKVESEKAKAQRAERLKRERKQWMRFGNPFKLKGDETPLDLARTLGHDMKFRLIVETEQPIRETTSPYKLDDHRILLYAIQVKDLLRDPALSRRIEGDRIPHPAWADVALSDETTVDTARFRILRQAPPPTDAP